MTLDLQTIEIFMKQAWLSQKAWGMIEAIISSLSTKHWVLD